MSGIPAHRESRSQRGILRRPDRGIPIYQTAGAYSTCVPLPLAESLKWPTLTVLRGRFVRDDWRGNEADLLFSVERMGSETPVLVYVLLEHQSTPDRWLRLRLLGYCVQVWLRWQCRRHDDQKQLPLLVPLVFYQGA